MGAVAALRQAITTWASIMVGVDEYQSTPSAANMSVTRFAKSDATNGWSVQKLDYIERRRRGRWRALAHSAYSDLHLAVRRAWFLPLLQTGGIVNETLDALKARARIVHERVPGNDLVFRAAYSADIADTAALHTHWPLFSSFSHPRRCGRACGP